MRKIKFRGRGILAQSGEWVYGYFKQNAHGDAYIDNGNGLTIAVDPETVSQLVLSFGDGCEIYEGDIIQDEDDQQWVVEWYEPQRGFVTTSLEDEPPCIMTNCEWLDDPGVAVVGTRWDPEYQPYLPKDGQCEVYR